MASAGPYQARQLVTPPIKGSFPLDHNKVCSMEMVEYMLCLQVCLCSCIMDMCAVEAR